MGVKIVIPAKSYEAVRTVYPIGQPTLCIEEYIWSMVSGMEEYLFNHCQHFVAELKKVGSKWWNVSQLTNFLKYRRRL